MANGATADIPGVVRLPIQIQRRTYHHDFSILPALESAVLIGIDLWARTGITIPPPRRPPATPAAPRCSTTGGLALCTPREQQRLQAFLKTELEKFDAIRGPTTATRHHIRLRESTPIKQRYRPRNPAMQAIIDREVNEMEAAGVIEASHSAWSSPVVIVKKKDGKHRFCIDFRRFTVMPFGLHSAPATFQRLLDTILGPALEPHVFVYLNDIIILSRTFDEHLELLAEVFRRLRDARLRLNPEKCRFCVGQLKYLGHVIDQDGIRTDPEKVSAVNNWPEPTTVKQVRQFLGMASWYRRFIASFSTIAAPLTRLTKKNARWSWGPAEGDAFRALKRILVSAPVLACPDFSRLFVLQTDASTDGLGAVLTQNYEEGERVIAYASRTLNGAELVEVAAKLEAPTGRLARWLFELQQYDCEVKYRRGTLNRVADALSGQPEICAARPLRCRWYRRIYDAVDREPAAHPDYRIEENKLYRHVLHSLDFKEHPTEEQWKTCVPRENREEVMQRYHDAPTAGHLGVAKTIARIAERYHWPGMMREIATYVRNYKNCQTHKVAQTPPAGTLHATNIDWPWEQVTIDLVGPLPRSKTGNTWLLVIQFVDKNHRDWDENLPALQFAYNTATHDATGFSPAYLNYGRELCPPHPGDGARTGGADPATLPQKLNDANALVRVKLARAFQRQERYYNLRRRDWKPALGEWVWKREHPLSKKADAFNAKLAPKFVGPLEVRRIISPVVVDLRSRHGKWYRHIHVEHLKAARGYNERNQNIEQNNNIEVEGEHPLPIDQTDAGDDED
ncbi:reverse ribonuclease integrase [Lasius niger]|uniref:RNA-directed DNA polymerase n=1 Tax=Lasius niger TaxID=67767 RepID=A0A0J7K8S4_LASNI|nr:reverse ribonuclease integrase [Lasius niger]